MDLAVWVTAIYDSRQVEQLGTIVELGPETVL